MCQKKKSQYKSVKSGVFRSDYIRHINFQCLAVMLAKRWPQPFCIMVFTALQVKATLEPNPKMLPESNATNANFTRANNVQLFSNRCNLVAMETSDFLTAVLFVWKKSHVLCKRTVGVRKIVNDRLSKTRVGALRYCTVWMHEPILS